MGCIQTPLIALHAVPHTARPMSHQYPTTSPMPLHGVSAIRDYSGDCANRYIASPMPAFSPGLGSVGLSPFTDFAAGLPTLCTPGLVKDGVVPSPIMREVMMHHGSDDSPLHVFRQPLSMFGVNTEGQRGCTTTRLVQAAQKRQPGMVRHRMVIHPLMVGKVLPQKEHLANTNHAHAKSPGA